MHVLDAIRTRRTVKRYSDAPLDVERVVGYLDAARWAPNHRMTQPWRFRVVGPRTLEALKELAGEGAAKLETAPVLVVASFAPSPLPLHAEEDEHAAAVATYLPLLAAHADGVASFWRTPNFLRTDEGRAAAGVPAEERVLGLLYFGVAAEGELPAPERDGTDSYVSALP